MKALRYIGGLVILLTTGSACTTTRVVHSAPPPPPPVVVSRPAPVARPVAVAAAPVNVTYQTFYDELAPYGSWIQYPGHGFVWSPAVGPEFQPYATAGHWVMTEYGNTWVSDYVWGWAPFHYGRWFFDDYYGWLWVPGSEWGPAWVAWRSGGGYYGWAPLGPGMFTNVNTYHLPANYWIFVEHRYITRPRIYTYCVPRTRVVNVYHNTTIINNYHVVNNRTYVYGPRPQEIQKHTNQRVPIHRISNETRPGSARVDNGNLRMYRPEVGGGRNNETPSRIVDRSNFDRSRAAGVNEGGRADRPQNRGSELNSSEPSRPTRSLDRGAATGAGRNMEAPVERPSRSEAGRDRASEVETPGRSRGEVIRTERPDAGNGAPVSRPVDRPARTSYPTQRNTERPEMPSRVEEPQRMESPAPVERTSPRPSSGFQPRESRPEPVRRPDPIVQPAPQRMERSAEPVRQAMPQRIEQRTEPVRQAPQPQRIERNEPVRQAEPQRMERSEPARQAAPAQRMERSAPQRQVETAPAPQAQPSRSEGSAPSRESGGRSRSRSGDN